MHCCYCRLRHTCDTYAEAKQTPGYITGCCERFTFDTSLSVDDVVGRKKKPMTNGDCIRAMSDEELAEFLNEMQLNEWEYEQEEFPDANRTFKDLTVAWFGWLKQPAEVDNEHR